MILPNLSAEFELWWRCSEIDFNTESLKGEHNLAETVREAFITLNKKEPTKKAGKREGEENCSLSI